MSSDAEIDPNEKLPFPLPPSLEDQKEWVDSVLATPGVNIHREALENVAPFIVGPEAMLTSPDEAGRRRVRGAALRRLRTEAGDMLVAVVEMHGVGGSVWEYNERISSEWHSVANPAALREDSQALSRVRPLVRVTAEGKEEIFAAVETEVSSRESLIMNLEKAAAALAKKDGHRTYNLLEDLVLNGQQEPGLYIAQHIRIQDPALEDRDGNPLHPQSHWQWMAVRGNNRTKQRHEIFEVKSAEVVTGMPVKRIGGEGEKIIFDPNQWLPRLSRLLNEEYIERRDDVLESHQASRGLRAVRVAVVEAHLVIGCPTPGRLYRIAQMSNRRDHVHPPLDFTPNDRGRALGRSVLGVYVAEGLLDEKTADVLSGAASITELAGVPADATVSELRDIRSMRLLAEFFPTDRRKQLLIRRALSESPPSQLTAPEVNRRARAWSALTSESYPEPWNPRIGEVFQLGEARGGLTISGRSLRELLDVAAADNDALRELIFYRAAHWLASSDIIDADRGSLSGQKTDDDDGVKADRVRRTVRNNLNAMYNRPEMAVGVLRELALAMDEGDRRPRKVGASGEPLIEPMTRAWFNREFPKESGSRSNLPAARHGGTGPAQPSESSLHPVSTGGTTIRKAPSEAAEGSSAAVEVRTSVPDIGPDSDDRGPGRADGVGAAGGGTVLASSQAGMAKEFMAQVYRLADDAVALDTLVSRLAAMAGQAPLEREDAEDATQSVLATAIAVRRLVARIERLGEAG
ncbi:hypothetical protein [Streptomyces sp. NPDC048252]|uniref:hypothetical protein n=1 Tax=Streptomyces sp. NPDC048252 TaxID=3154612 RepID=UPI003416871F